MPALPHRPAHAPPPASSRASAALLALLAACTSGGRAPHPADPRLAPVDDCAVFRAPELEQRLDAATGSVAREGNAVTLLVNGEAAFARRFENAAGAELILLKTFIFTEDEMGTRVADLLVERAQAGAHVIVQYDVKGSIAGVADIDEMLERATTERPAGEKRIIARMRAAGVVIVGTNSPARAIEAREWADNAERLLRDPAGAIERSAVSLRLLNHCDHEKYWITGKRRADGELELRAILGGMNIASEYAYGGTTQIDATSKRGGWRDTDIELAGPVVNDIVARYFDAQHWHEGRNLPDLAQRARWNPAQPAAGTARVRFVWNHPAAGTERHIERLYEALIDATPRAGVVRLETAYYAPTKIVRRAIKRALGRGTRVAILTNSDVTNDIKAVADASRYAFYALLRQGGVVALFERLERADIGELTLHSKVASFGTCGPVIVGSANLDGQSSEHNTESVVLVDDPALRRDFDQMFEADIAPDRATRISMEHFKSSAWAWLRQSGAYYLGNYWL